MGHIRRALNALVQAGDLRVLRTSGFYESKAMYVEDQADFLNGAIEVGLGLMKVGRLAAAEAEPTTK
jgi:2-amino-4-hydroxy-6-hydroxymethyldihydropteridine diphosphokinase/dihydropteroate synthase